MSRTLKDKTQYKVKKALKTLIEAQGALNYLKSTTTKGSKKKGLRNAYSKPFTKDDLAFRNMDPAFKEWWKHHDEQYDRDNGLDWWLEFGFPTWREALTTMLSAEVDIKMRSIRWA